MDTLHMYFNYECIFLYLVQRLLARMVLLGSMTLWEAYCTNLYNSGHKNSRERTKLGN
jgi:hypothetical protein